MKYPVAIYPDSPPNSPRDRGFTASERRDVLVSAAESAGAVVVPPAEAKGLVWLGHGSGKGLAEVLDEHPGIQWVQLPSAGIEAYVDVGVLREGLTVTCAKGSFAGQVAESALLLSLAALRNITEQARTKSWLVREPGSLLGARVTIIGGGGIATDLIRMLAGFDSRVTVVRRQAVALDGAERTVTTDHLHDVLPETDVLILALALTPDNVGLIGERELALLPNSAVVVNVARGRHVTTSALVAALQSGSIAAAGLDVTDPEPLPDGHPLWDMDNVLITSHCADSMEYVTEQLGQRVAENILRLTAGDEPLGIVNADHGY